jgi:hypothetical protein
MAKAAKKNPTANGGSSSPKGKNGNGGNGKGAGHDADKQPVAPAATPTPAIAVEEPREKKRKGRALTEGEPLKRVLIFLSDDDITRLKSEVGERGMSTKVRERPPPTQCRRTGQRESHAGRGEHFRVPTPRPTRP